MTDECKIGKRKYNRGRKFEGYRIFGMIERGGCRLDICLDNCRSEETISPLMKKYIKEGTEIHFVLWKGYINYDNERTHRIMSSIGEL